MTVELRFFDRDPVCAEDSPIESIQMHTASNKMTVRVLLVLVLVRIRYGQVLACSPLGYMNERTALACGVVVRTCLRKEGRGEVSSHKHSRHARARALEASLRGDEQRGSSRGKRSHLRGKLREGWSIGPSGKENPDSVRRKTCDGITLPSVWQLRDFWEGRLRVGDVT